jgi:hypothetical protein
MESFRLNLHQGVAMGGQQMGSTVASAELASRRQNFDDISENKASVVIEPRNSFRIQDESDASQM